MSKKILVLQFKHETNAFCPAPANMTATVLGIDNCGGIIIRLTRGCEAPCRKDGL